MINMSKEKRKTIIQFIKYSLTGTMSTVIQIILITILYQAMKDWKAPLPHFLLPFFNERTVGPGHVNWGYVLPLLISLTISNTISYIINRRHTFRSDAPAWHFILYLLVLAVLTLLCTWIQGILINRFYLLGKQPIAHVHASLAAAVIQGLIMFPLNKFVLLREKDSQ